MAETAARITKHMNACADAVTEIDAIKDGSHYFFGKKDGQGNAYYDQKHYNMHVWDNLNHLKLQQEQQWYKDDSVSRSGNAAKAKHTAAIKTAEDYLAANT